MRFLLCMLFVLTMPLYVHADDEPIDTIHYVLSVDQTASDLTPFRIALASRGYDFVAFSNDIRTESTLGFMGTETDGVFNFRLLIARDLFIHELSPLLYDRYDDVILSQTVGQFIGIPSRKDLTDYLDFTLQYINGDCEAVIQLGEQLDPSELELLSVSFFNFAMGNCSLIEVDADTAVIYYAEAVKLLEDQDKIQPAPIVASHVNLAWTYIQLGNIEPARETLDQLVEISTDYSETMHAFVLQTRAQLLALMFDYTAAIDDINAVIGMYKSDYGIARAYKQRGDIIMLIYEWNRALEDYNTAIELDSDYAEAYYRRGILLYTMVEREDAITDFETYLELEPEGQFAESATTYIDNIQTELDALGG